MHHRDDCVGRIRGPAVVGVECALVSRFSGRVEAKQSPREALGEPGPRLRFLPEAAQVRTPDDVACLAQPLVHGQHGPRFTELLHHEVFSEHGPPPAPGDLAVVWDVRPEAVPNRAVDLVEEPGVDVQVRAAAADADQSGHPLLLL